SIMTEYSNIFESVKKASLGLIRLSDEKIQSILKDLAALAIRKTDFILAENQRDLERMD
ncbi:MAG TPA: gamma-glutamyl-phosphate reductase, partial [Algoriphagus sp.]|nr:gamma-glutamyl-phosphate reductase [Algoriphagus sp.]